MIQVSFYILGFIAFSTWPILQALNLFTSSSYYSVISLRDFKADPKEKKKKEGKKGFRATAFWLTFS